MDADVHNLLESDFYRILDFKCRCRDSHTSEPEYGEAFSISFVRKGNFLFNVFQHSLDAHTGRVLLSKPGYVRTVTHLHETPDECTIFEFKGDFYQEVRYRYGHSKFFSDCDLHSTLVGTNTQTEFLHLLILQSAGYRSGSQLQTDQLVLEMMDKVLGAVSDYTPDSKIPLKLKRNHLETIERAKHYIGENFVQDISLQDIATYCHVSPFHFSRIFKTFTSCSPHHFLLDIRLQHAAMLLHDTSLSVADVCFSSGFNSIEYFTAVFKKNYGCPPATFRNNPPL